MARSARAKKPQPLEHRLLLTATFCRLAGGAVMVYSASSARTLLQGQGDGTAYLVKYLAYGTVGLAIMHLVSRQGLDATPRLPGPLLAIAFAMLVAVKLPGIGVTVNGAKRWLGAGPLQFQPSQLMKLALVLYAAKILSERPKSVRTLKGVVNPLVYVFGAALLLIVSQPDLGTALVIAFTFCALLVAAGMPLRYLATGIGIGVVLVSLFAI